MPRSIIYREVNCQNRLTLKDRIRVLKTYKKIKSYNKLADEFKCSLYQIRGIIRDQKKIKEKYFQTTEYKIKRYEKAVQFQVVILLEKVMYEWFQRAQRHIETGAITNEILLQKAEEAKHILSMKFFHIDLNWLLKFRQKYNITELDMTMLMIGNDDEPLSLDMNEIAMYVVNRNAVSADFSYTDAESLSDLEDNEIQINNQVSQKFHLVPTQYCNNNNDETRIPDENVATVEANVVELVLPICNDEQAKCYLKPLEDYVLMTENFRAIGLIAQLEEIFSTTTKK